MNSKRRAKAYEVKRSLETALAPIESLIDAEESAREGIPENMQTRVERCEDTVNDLANAKTTIEEAIEYLESAVTR